MIGAGRKRTRHSKAEAQVRGLLTAQRFAEISKQRALAGLETSAIFLIQRPALEASAVAWAVTQVMHGSLIGMVAAAVSHLVPECTMKETAAGAVATEDVVVAEVERGVVLVVAELL